MKLQIVKLNKDAQIPSKSNILDVGLDLVATSKKIVDKDTYGYYEYGTGLAISIPDGYGGFIFPRSSLSKTGHILANSVGVIDPGYTGEIKVRFKHIPGCVGYNKGDKIAQLVIMPYVKDIEFEVVDDLEESSRGEGGFGSTGN